MDEKTPTLRIRLQEGSDEFGDLDLTFTEVFRIGRDPSCEVRLPSPLVSRRHAEIWPGHGSWWVRDLGSTNRLILNGKPIDRGELKDGDTLQLGKGAPTLTVSFSEIEEDGYAPFPFSEGGQGSPVSEGSLRKAPREAGSTVRMKESWHGETPGPGAPPGSPSDDSGPSLSEIEEKYLNPQSDQPAGQRTQFIRMAFAQVQKREKRKSRLVLGAVGIMLLVSGSYAILQRYNIRRIDRQAAVFFQSVKEIEVQLVDLRQQAEELGSPGLLASLSALDSQRRASMDRYEAYVRDRGLYRRLRTREDTLIYETARVFGESEFEISNSFIEAVLTEIRTYWLAPRGRSRFLGAIGRAEENGYTGRIVDIMEERGVPPEYFYLALQESEFREKVVGPPTRYGHAKGMWQFIPATAERYGLRIGALADTDEPDPNDERLNFEAATNAASRYLRDLHGILTQASGLLVMAAYNWGEHRVAPRLESLPEPRDVFREEFSGVPTNPASRNYWAFLSEYEDRMPEQTKEYVIRIFAAAVIGRDPQHFGLDLEDPLAPYVN